MAMRASASTRKPRASFGVLLDPIVLSTPRLCGKEIVRTQSAVARSACLTLAAAANPLLISRITANFALSAPRCCWLEPQRDSRGAGWLPETEALGGVTG